MAKYLGLKLRTYQNKEAKKSVEFKKAGHYLKIAQLHHVYLLYIVGVYDELNLSRAIKTGIRDLYFKDKK